jgi:hypothetical protein
MTVEAKTLSDPSRSHPPRKLRNFLLEPKFQLKYSGMVVAVTVVVASALGYQAYRYSTGQTQLMNIERMEAKGAAVDARFISDLDRYARQADRRVVLGILGAIGVLALALGMTGIVITHRVVGPAYRLKRMFRMVGAGRIRPPGGLRRHDELRDVFDAFQTMLQGLRTQREDDLRELDAAIEQARAAGMPASAIERLGSLRERIARSIE